MLSKMRASSRESTPFLFSSYCCSVSEGVGRHNRTGYLNHLFNKCSNITLVNSFVVIRVMVPHDIEIIGTDTSRSNPWKFGRFLRRGRITHISVFELEKKIEVCSSLMSPRFDPRFARQKNHAHGRFSWTHWSESWLQTMHELFASLLNWMIALPCIILRMISRCWHMR